MSTTRAIEWWGPTLILLTIPKFYIYWACKTYVYLGPIPNFPSLGEPKAFMSPSSVSTNVWSSPQAIYLINYPSKSYNFVGTSTKSLTNPIPS